MATKKAAKAPKAEGEPRKRRERTQEELDYAALKKMKAESKQYDDRIKRHDEMATKLKADREALIKSAADARARLLSTE